MDKALAWNWIRIDLVGKKIQVRTPFKDFNNVTLLRVDDEGNITIKISDNDPFPTVIQRKFIVYLGPARDEEHD